MIILILCTGNSCRSQMAEGFFRHYSKSTSDDRKSAVERKITVFSAGLETHGLNSKAVQVMAEIGIDISAHRSTNLSEYLSEKFDLVITVCDHAAANCPVFPGDIKKLHWPFDDPAKSEGSQEEILNEFRRIRDEIDEKVKHWFTQIHS